MAVKTINISKDTLLNIMRNHPEKKVAISVNSVTQKYKSGDKILVKEPIREECMTINTGGQETFIPVIEYVYTGDKMALLEMSAPSKDEINLGFVGEASSSAMPVQYARYVLEVIDVEIKFIQDMSYSDVIALGFKTFAQLMEWWDARHKKGEKWADNPAVYLYNCKAGVKNGIHYFQTGMNNPKDIPQAPVNHGRNGSGMPSAPAINALDFIHSMATS